MMSARLREPANATVRADQIPSPTVMTGLGRMFRYQTVHHRWIDL